MGSGFLLAVRWMAWRCRSSKGALLRARPYAWGKAAGRRQRHLPGSASSTARLPPDRPPSGTAGFAANASAIRTIPAGPLPAAACRELRPSLTCRSQAGVGVQKRCDRLGPATLGRQVQRGPAIAVPCVQGGTGGHKRRNHLDVAPRHRIVQRGHAVTGCRVRAGTGGEATFYVSCFGLLPERRLLPAPASGPGLG